MTRYFTHVYCTILGLIFFIGLNAQERNMLPGLNFHGFIGHPFDGKPALLVKDVPHDQVLRECKFYGGDSLYGFDFGAKSRQAEVEGNVMYSEFLSFMFKQQSEFIKKKYKISQLPYEIEIENRSKIAKDGEMKMRYPSNQKGIPPGPNGACNNLDMETGDFTGWVGGSGYNSNSNLPLTLQGTAYYDYNMGVNDCSDLQLISTAYGNDPFGNFPGKDPSGGTWSARIGDRGLNKAQGYGYCDAPSYHWSATYSNGEYIEQTFVVTAANALLSYDYAVVLNDGSHPNGQQPYFHVEITNSSGTPLSSCTTYSVQCSAGVPPPGFSSYGNDNGPVYYKGWTANSVNLTPYIGQTVIAKFTAAGCIQGGHFGYGYLDATCGPAQVITSNATPCPGSNVILTAPAVTGGTYSWSGPGIVGSTTGQTATVNASGTYNVTVTPSQGPGCAYALSFVVTFTGPTSVGTSATTAACSLSNGTATANPSGGTPGYTYLWSPGGQNTQTANGLSGGTYTVVVTDSHGCTKSNTVVVPATTAPNVTATSTAAGCSVNNGTATANPSGGTPNYTYLWSPGGQNTQTANGLASGTYTVLITDANGCTKSTTIVVGSTSSPTIPSTTSTPAGCSVNNGTATANPAGGTPNYTYLWSPGGQNTQTATGLAGGTYTILVTDANGCTKSTTVVVGSTNAPTIPTTTSTSAGCSVANGTATANPSGGTPGYTYSWSPSGQSTQTATGLAGGSYTVHVTDANGCAVNAVVNVGSTSAPSATASSTPATCATANGTGTANPSGGTPGYTYSWSPGGQNTQTATGLSAGNYIVTVTDANGCTASASVTITSANGPTSTTSVINNISCNGGNDGSATANPTGGTPGYTFAWSPGGQNTQTVTGLSAGNYTVVITDANGCSFVNTASVTQPTVLAAITTPSNIPCNGGNNGSATVNPSGGTPNYTYTWNTTPIQNTQTATGLSPGNYNVSVIDANGCSIVSSVTITQPTVLSSTASQTNVSCNGGNNGSATATPSGGTANYTYAWSPSGGNAQTANNLTAGNYTVTITDAHGCTSTSSVTITQPPVITSTYTNTNVLCNGGNNGSATVTPSGGTPNYTYSWSPSGGNAQTANNLSPGTYQCTVTDAKGCTNVTVVTITQPQPLSASTTATNILCNGGNNGSATATVSNGTAPYTYAWSPNGGNAQTANNLSAGNYTVTVTDANGCTKQSPVTITEPAPITLSVSGSDSICNGGSSVLTANVNGGSPAYTYVWNPGPQSNSSITVSPTSSASYSVAITDANGCASLSQVFNVSVLPTPNALFDTSSVGTYSSLYTFSDLSTPSVTITGWNWNFGDNTSNSTQQNPVHTFPGAGTYTVTEIVFNKFGCPDTFTTVITINEGILIPNVFTPDGDGVNDVWYIPNSGMKEFHVDIYDRWGAKVFETTADEIRWDGHSTSGKLLTDGTYYFVLKAYLKSGSGEKNYSANGYVTLLTQKH